MPPRSAETSHVNPHDPPTGARETCAILDFGSQYTQLIARRVRENRVYSEIHPFGVRADRLRSAALRGVILSGGPCGVYEEGAPDIDPAIFQLGVPVLGICYGMQLGCKVLGGEVRPATEREYGNTRLEIERGDDPLFEGLGAELQVWMSHGDQVVRVADQFQALARTRTSPLAVVRNREGSFYGLQFHPEVAHTRDQGRLIRNFLYNICGFQGDWALTDYIGRSVEEIRARVGGARVVCALSGGVDSSVVALLVHRAIGDRLTCIFVDNGLLREGEAGDVQSLFAGRFHLDFRAVDASARFLERLRGVEDPEEKRKRIGHQFIEEFRSAARTLGDARFLAQGTLYPDVIESVAAHGGPTASIKSHHNVGGLPAELGFELVEPLRFLFKDEVRMIGRELGLPESVLSRQPFPGPGLAVRILGEVSRERLALLRAADRIVQEEMRAWEGYPRLWQSFAVLLPVRTVGVQGDQRTYDHVIALRIVESSDGMTADWVHPPQAVLRSVSSRIVNEVAGVNRVVLDISTKPPSTIEWE